jgi:hypothetical protein
MELSVRYKIFGKELRTGDHYVFTHKRKGTFRAQFRRLVVAPADDHQDRVFLECMIDTSQNGTPHLARVKGETDTLTNIRPSLLTEVREAPVLKELQGGVITAPARKRTFWQKIKHTFERGE